MEAEYIACFLAIEDTVWICQLFKDLDLERYRPTRVFVDTSSARQLAMNPVHHKHIDIKYHWIRDLVADKMVILIHVPAEDQRTDILTKTVSGVVFKSHVDYLLSTQF